MHWKTTLTSIGVAIMSALAALAALPYQLGDLATVIPPEWKVPIFKTALCAGIALHILNGIVSADKNVAPLPSVIGSVLQKMPMILFALFCSLAIFSLFTGCATNTADEAANTRGRVINAILDGGAHLFEHELENYDQP